MADNKLDVNFFKPFVDGTLETLKVQCSFIAKPGKPFLKTPDTKYPVDLAAVIGLTANVFNGSIAICFTKEVFLTAMSNMLGETFDIITPELEDGASELLNIIFGQAKRILSEKGYKIDKAIPTIVRGTDMHIKCLTASPVFVLPFVTEKGIFHIEIAAEKLLNCDSAA